MTDESMSGFRTETPASVSGHLRVRVRMVETVDGATSAAATAGRFTGQRAAEAFMRAETMKCKAFGSVGRRHWGRNHADHQVFYWIETDQETASVRNQD
jgi:hypothetical protein